MGEERETLTWPLFGEATQALARDIAGSGFAPDVVLAIARGGLTVAGALAYALGVKNCCSINVEFYTGVDERLPVPVVLPPSLDLVDVRGLKVLVADDVADTGQTLALVLSMLKEEKVESRGAVLYQKPRSIVDVDHVWRSTTRWITFPWSAEPPVTEADARPA
jgi:hypothetical protein